MKLVVPYQIPFLAPEVGGGLLAGVYAATDFWWTLEDKYPLAKMFVEAFEKKFGYKPEWGANNAYMSFALWAEAVENAGSFYPPDVIKSYEAGRKIQSTVGEVYFRKEDHQLVRPVVIVQGKKPSEMKNKEDFWDVLEVDPGRAADAEAGRVRLQSRRLHLKPEAGTGNAGGFAACALSYDRPPWSPGLISSRSCSTAWRWARCSRSSAPG